MGREGCGSFDSAALPRHLGDEPVRLASRAGKLAHLLVHATEGIAYSVRGETVHFLEVFRPRSRREYETQIYREPGPFIR